MPSYITLKARVYDITKNKSLYNIHAYIEYSENSEKRYEFFTLQTKKKIPEIILEKYGETEEVSEYYYPKVFITPTPSKKIRKQTTDFDGKRGQTIDFDSDFYLVVVYANDIPSRVYSDRLIRMSEIRIYEKNGRLQNMYVEGICGLDDLIILNINKNNNLKYTPNKNKNNKNNLKLRSYNINLKRANLNDLLMFFSYNFRNNQSNKDGELEKIGTYIFIGEGRNLSCKQSYIAPKDIKILEFYK
jgi:hypothetical protein